MMDVKLRKVQSTVDKKLSGMIKKFKSGQAFLQMQIYPRYLEHQQFRWQTENWGAWKDLNSDYAEKKKRVYASYPGGGIRMMIATGRTINAVLGRNKFHRKIVTEKSLIVGIGGTEPDGDLEYAKYAGAMRPFMDFENAMGKRFVKDAKNLYRKWVMG